MASYGKITFNLEVLREKSLAGIEEKIEAVKEQMALVRDDGLFQAALEDWREEQFEKIRGFAMAISAEPYAISNEDLANFKTEPAPKQDLAMVARLDRELRALQTQRDSLIIKAGALVPDEHGNISLTKTQLHENFGLV